MLRQLSYAIKNQLKAPYLGYFLPFTVSLWYKGVLCSGRIYYRRGVSNIIITPIIKDSKRLKDRT